MKYFRKEQAISRLIQSCRTESYDLFKANIDNIDEKELYGIIITLRVIDEKYEDNMYSNFIKLNKMYEREGKNKKELVRKELIRKEIESDDGLCLICKENERETVCDPCGCIVVCEPCSRKLENEPGHEKVCIHCRQRIYCISYIKSGSRVFLT